MDETQIPQLLLDRYRVEGILGEGGLGTVIKAFDVRLRRFVAIKTIRPELFTTDPDLFRDAQERFRREAIAGSRTHGCPNLVTVYDFVDGADDTLYLILEYVPGGTLDDLLARGPVPLPRALTLIAEAARGLAVLHANSIVHRDIKPANIFIAADGRAEVGDFGIVQLDDLSQRAETARRHPGTQGYMAPEQEHSLGYMTPAADQYSLGLVFFELLAGNRYRKLQAAEREAAFAAMPAEVGAIIRRMLAPEPGDRFPGMEAVVEAIGAVHLSAAEPTVLRPPVTEPLPPGFVPSPPLAPFSFAAPGAGAPRTPPAAAAASAAPRHRRRAVLLGAGAVVVAGAAGVTVVAAGGARRVLATAIAVNRADVRTATVPRPSPTAAATATLAPATPSPIGANITSGILPALPTAGPTATLPPTAIMPTAAAPITATAAPPTPVMPTAAPPTPVPPATATTAPPTPVMPTPVPAPTVPAATPTPPPPIENLRPALATIHVGDGGAGYGFSVWGLEPDSAFRDTLFTRVRDTGFSWLRQSVNWAAMEQSKGNFGTDFTKALDDFVAGAAASGMKVLLSIGKSPDWAGAGGGLLVKPEDFRTLMLFLTGRYRGRVHAYEIWTGQNLGSQTMGRVNVAGYVPILKAGYEAVKAADPNAVVVFGGLAPTGTNTTTALNDVEYLRQIYALNGGEVKRYYDVLGSHVYGNCNPPDSSWPANPPTNACARDPDGSRSFTNDNSFYFQRVQEQRAAMEAAGESAKQLWLTEFGWTVSSFVSGSDQAQYLTRAFAIGKSLPWMGSMFVWNLNYAAIAQPDPEASQWSILQRDGTPRPAYTALQRLPK